MSRTSNFRRQHADMLALAADIQNMMAEPITDDSAKLISQALMKLTGKLKIHLAQEDQSLYPRAAESADTNMASVAKQFQREMGGLSETYLTFASRWQTPSAIGGNPAGFKSETEGVFKALAARINRENRELYPLIDQL